ncbi:hypothetical protein [Nocardia lijiangensis]|uniref:hypothetical protein n=1 Tax=Nocardia lijiangensis TaxID=299618 RepID=UPI000836F85F|nr:hypothetical protein [Nocardia lijiangensis]
MDDDNEKRPHSTVTESDLRELLAAGPEACLVLLEGRVEIAEGAADGLTIATRDDVAGRAGAEPDQTRMRELAAELACEIRLQGA